MPDTIIAETPSNFIVQGPRQRSMQWGDLMAALAKAQGEIEGAKKDSLNPAFKQPGKPEGSKYADLASVWDAIREPMSKHGLAIMQWPRVTENAVEIETIVAHGEQFISDVLWMPCGKMDAHGIGSAITYGRRYALMAVAGVAPEDDDGNGAVEGHKPGAAGSASGGGDFRPAGPRRFQGASASQSSWGPGGKAGAIAEAERDGLIDHIRKKGELPRKAGEPTPDEVKAAERAAKLKTKTDERVNALKAEKNWTREKLDKFWADNTAWREWMSDPANEALKEYERFTDAFLDAENSIKPVELA